MTKDSLPLVHRALRREKGAFSALVQEHQRLALSVAYGVVGDPHTAADVVQDAFVKAYQNLDQLQDPDRFLGWFLTIVRSTATDVVRRRVRWGSREVALADGVLDAGMGPRSEGTESAHRPLREARHEQSSPDEVMVQQEESAAIRSAIATLSAEYREVLMLKHVEGKSYRDLAQMLDTSVRAVESRLFRARQQLLRALKTRLGRSSEWSDGSADCASAE